MDARTTRNARMLIEEGVSLLKSDGAAPSATSEHSKIRLLNAIIANPTSWHREAPFEFRTSNEIAERLGRAPEPGCAFLPIARDLTAASPPAGGYLVSTVNPGDGIFIDWLRAASVTMSLGVQEPPLTSNATLPSIAADSTSYWLSSETAAISESNQTFGQVSMSPKTAGSYFELSNKFLKQISPAAEAFVLRGIAGSVAAKVDAGAIAGSGSSGEPLGVINSGIGTQSGASLTWAATCAAIAYVEDNNGMVNPSSTGWAIASDAAEIMRARAKATRLGFILADGLIDGRPALVSNAVPAGCAIFGDWSQLVLGSWGALEIGVNRADAGPYCSSSAPLVFARCGRATRP